MSDFSQNGIISTLHDFGTKSTVEIEKELLSFSKQRKMELILPCLYSELEGTALPKIVKEISKTKYLDHIIVGLDKGLYKSNNIELEIIEPKGHYDGFRELAENNIQLATNEPLHLIEKYQNNICSIGNFFETNGGIIFTIKGYENLVNGKEIKITSPVSNTVTD